MKLGVCYYPEHWPQERWTEDARLMREAGLSLVRIADFAWTVMEPREGVFSWSWLDRAIEVLVGEDLQIVLCTPTASPPSWLCRAYPEILPVDAEGRRRRFGSRRHYCPNSAVYRKHTERIVTAMGARYGNHPAVAGWQIDNEFGCHDTARCYCNSCSGAFRRWLEGKYGAIESLNDAWGAVFWSQEDWGLGGDRSPNLTIAEPNPSHVLDYYRFSSDSFVAYQGLQMSLLQPRIGESQFVTTNFMSQFADLDYYNLAKPLDFVTMSSYPTGHAEARPSLYLPSNTLPAFAYDVGDHYVTSLGHSLMRGFKPGRPFWVMEQQCGNVNWSRYNTGVRPGTVRLWTWHALASGAEAVLYFRWRAGLFAQEQLHSGLLHHDASPAVGLGDLKAMKGELSLMSEISSVHSPAEIALLLDYDSLWAIRQQPHHQDFAYMRHLFVFYRALLRLGLPVEVVSADADLGAYKIVIAPSAYVATERLVRSLEDFCEAGGTALLSVRAGFKTSSNLVTDLPLPGLLRGLVGATVDDWHSLPPGVGFELDTKIPGLLGPASVWAEALSPFVSDTGSGNPDPEVLAHYNSGPFSSSAALVENKVGTGRALYLGWMANDQQAEALMAALASQSEIHPLAELPEGLIISRRGPHLILLNFTDSELTARVEGQAVQVGPRDVQVLKSNKN